MGDVFFFFLGMPSRREDFRLYGSVAGERIEMDGGTGPQSCRFGIGWTRGCERTTGFVNHLMGSCAKKEEKNVLLGMITISVLTSEYKVIKTEIRLQSIIESRCAPLHSGSG